MSKNCGEIIVGNKKFKKRENMSDEHKNNPMHGVKLEMIINSLVEDYGWQGLDERIKINCFYNNPSVKSSLKFLRKTPWARKKVENLYLDTLKRKES